MTGSLAGLTPGDEVVLDLGTPLDDWMFVTPTSSRGASLGLTRAALIANETRVVMPVVDRLRTVIDNMERIMATGRTTLPTRTVIRTVRAVKDGIVPDSILREMP